MLTGWEGILVGSPPTLSPPAEDFPYMNLKTPNPTPARARIATTAMIAPAPPLSSDGLALLVGFLLSS